MNNKLREYQTIGIDRAAEVMSYGMKKVCVQLATGGGKTVMFAGLVKRYLDRNDKNILILVHRAELLKQARLTIYNWHSIVAEPITAGVKNLPPARVHVAMIETAFNRIKKKPDYFKNVGLVIIDECHIGNFNKIIPHFPDTLILGFTATPISSSKKRPLKNIYEAIVCCVDIPHLIELGALVPNKTYHAKNVSRSELQVASTGEFDEKQMSGVYSKSNHIQNTIKGYEKYCLGKKTLVFNCSVEHSQLVNDAFLNSGYNSRHLDGNTPEHEREAAILWFKNTPGAILNNIGVLTTGFDEPSVEAVVVNKSTLSLPLWLQMTGRGSRPFPGKNFFTIVDMGGNAMSHSDWCDPRDWEDMFYNPQKPAEDGVAPVRECIECEALISASSRVCKFCGAEQPAPEIKYDAKEIEFEQFSKGIEVEKLIDRNKDKKPYYTLHEIKQEIINNARNELGKTITEYQADKLLTVYQERVADWCKATERKYNQWHKTTTADWFYAELLKVFNYTPPELKIAI